MILRGIVKPSCRWDPNIYERDTDFIVAIDCFCFCSFSVYFTEVEKQTLVKILVGIAYTYIGLVLFLQE